MGTEVSVKGMRKLDKKLIAMAKAMAGKNLETALLAGSLVISNEAKVRAPVLTGTLARSITQEVVVDGETATARVGTNVEYATAQEFGTARFPAQPYLRPAVDSKRDEAMQEIVESLRLIVRASVA